MVSNRLSTAFSFLPERTRGPGIFDRSFQEEGQMANLNDAFKLLLAIQGEHEAISQQKPGDVEEIPAIHSRLWGRRKKILITVEDEDK